MRYVRGSVNTRLGSPEMPLSLRAIACLLAFMASAWSSGPALAEVDFGAGVRDTPWLKPQEQVAKFKAPPGFRVDLVAAEPDLLKPMNLAFDGRGRLWVTVTQEYPFAAPAGQGRDAVRVLDDFDAQGRARKISTFVEGLNIPIGLYPTVDGGAIVFTIAQVLRLYDDDRDGRADRRETLLTGYGTGDTHGMTNAFRRGFDGHLYACHGFSNTSHLRGRDGSKLDIQSGHTYRFRIDGTGLAVHTYGQVNPFGLAFDSAGRLFSADCHSRPIYELLRGAHYPSFGKPHDGMGFAPEVTRDGHGSTAIAGIVRYEADAFPAPYQGQVFIGNVLTSRVHRDALSAHGATLHAKQLEPLLTCEDPWFRPVDLALGPDGALYIADFYNRIIGHYEVDLKHPGRDRTSGRIWRLSFPTQDPSPQRSLRSLDSLDTPSLIESLASPNLTLRMLATDQLTDRVGRSAAGALREALASSPFVHQRVHALWALHRLSELTGPMLGSALDSPDALLRLHACRVVAELPSGSAGIEAALTRVMRAMEDPDALVRRCAAEALGQHPDGARLPAILQAWERADPRDLSLIHVLRLAAREQFRAPGDAKWVEALDIPQGKRAGLIEIAASAGGEPAVRYITRELLADRVLPSQWPAALKAVARHADAAACDRLALLGRERLASHPAQAWEALTALAQGLAHRGDAPGLEAKRWAVSLATPLLPAAPAANAAAWRPDPAGRAWGLQPRPCNDGVRSAQLLSSHTLGEQYTGVLRSEPFTLPASLSFFLAGHNGQPPKPREPLNFIRLVLVDGGAEVARALPPRNDTAAKITWDLPAHSGKRGYIEVVDGDAAMAYAWLAVGRFEPEVVTSPRPDRDDSKLRELMRLASDWKLTELAPTATRLALDPNATSELRAASLRSAESLGQGLTQPALAGLLTDGRLPSGLRLEAARALNRRGDESARGVILESLRLGQEGWQVELGRTLAERTQGAAALLAAVEAKRVPPALLRDAQLAQRLRSSGLPDAAERIERQTRGLPPADEARRRLIADRLSAFAKAAANPERGGKAFTQFCAACHRIAGQGQMVGPQLDGIGLRGAARLAEDLLDPNRNVDPAFRYVVVHTLTGDSFAALPRRAEGLRRVFVDTQGRETSIAQDEIAREEPTAFSLMPANFGESIPAETFFDLLAYLEAQATLPPVEQPQPQLQTQPQTQP